MEDSRSARDKHFGLEKFRCGWPGFADLSPCVSATQWIEWKLRRCEPAGWRTMSGRFVPYSLLSERAAITAIRIPPAVINSGIQSLPSGVLPVGDPACQIGR